MFRAVSSVFQGLQWLWRRRVLPVLLGLLLAILAFDHLIYCITEAQWFATLGFGDLFWSRVWAQTQLFFGFLLIALGLARLFLRPVTQFSPAASPGASPALRGRLSGFEPLRERISRLAWSILMVSALVLARDFSRHWSDWLFLRGAAGAGPESFGLPRAVWTHFLPLFEPFLGVLWDFSLLLWLVVAATGVLRALPLLAARAPAPPLALPRTLWRLGAVIVALRALVYLVRLLDLARGRALETGDLVVSAPIFGVSALVCLSLMISTWRRATARVAPQKFPRLGLSLAAALVLPGMLNWLSGPLRALLPDTPWIRAQRDRATRTAWQLAGPEMVPLPPATPIAAAWPVWDAQTWLATQRGAAFRGQRLVEWKSATLGFEKGKWGALAAGQGAETTTWMANRDAGKNTQLEFERLDFPAPNGTLAATSLPADPAFFGLEGRSLFGNGDFGVPIGSIWTKWAWAWRLRDILLPFDGAGATRLLVWRGARERAEKLAPFLTPGGEPRLVWEGQNPAWLLDLCAAGANFPGALSASDGELRGQNAASDGVVMRLDALSGAVSFFRLPGARKPDFWLDSWRRAGPLWKPATEIPLALREKLGASPLLLRTQLAVEEALRADDSGFTPTFFGPQPGFESGRGALWRALAVEKSGWRSLEASSDAPTERVWRRGEGDLGAKVRALEVELSKNAPPQAFEMKLGEPFVWPDAQAPGGWWLGRAAFAAPRVENSWQGTEGHGLRLWRVALTGAAPAARVEVAASALAARRLFSPVTALPVTALPVKKSESTPLSIEVQALHFHRAIQAAARRGDWPTFERESAHLQAVLEQLAARRAAGKP